MTKNFKFLMVFATMAALFSSCKKTTDLSILTSHKWVEKSATATYSDSGSVSHNLLRVDTVCTTSSYTEFHDNATNSALKLAYVYTTTNCAGQIASPLVQLSSWNIDPDNTILYLNGNTNDGSGGIWFNIQTLNNSSLVITQTYQNVIGYTSGIHPTYIYDTETDTYTYNVK